MCILKWLDDKPSKILDGSAPTKCVKWRNNNNGTNPNIHILYRDGQGLIKYRFYHSPQATIQNNGKNIGSSVEVIEVDNFSRTGAWKKYIFF